MHIYSKVFMHIYYRFHRTLRGVIARYQLKHNTMTYINILPDILKSYNNSYHTTIRMAPNQTTSENEHIVYENVYSRKKKTKPLKLKPFRYKIGDNVRIVSKKTPWSPEFFQRWSEEIFKVSRRYRGNNGVAHCTRLLTVQPKKSEVAFTLKNYQKLLPTQKIPIG